MRNRFPSIYAGRTITERPAWRSTGIGGHVLQPADGLFSSRILADVVDSVLGGYCAHLHRPGRAPIEVGSFPTVAAAKAAAESALNL